MGLKQVGWAGNELPLHRTTWGLSANWPRRTHFTAQNFPSFGSLIDEGQQKAKSVGSVEPPCCLSGWLS